MNAVVEQKAGAVTASPIDSVRTLLERLKPQLQMALPKHLTADRLLRVAITSCQNTPKLLECDRRSLLSAIMTCAQLGLEPDGVLGQAYLVPFKGRVQFIPGYKGLLTLARNTGQVVAISAHEVCRKDSFDYAYGLNERLEHVPAEGERGEITHFYAYAKFKDGGHYFEVLTRADVDKVRDKSEGYQAFKAGRIKSTPWADHYVQMGRKTAIRRIANYLPMDVQRAALLEGAYEQGRHAHMTDDGNVIIEGGMLDDGADGEARPKAIEAFEAKHGAGDEAEIMDPNTGEITSPPPATKPAPAEDIFPGDLPSPSAAKAAAAPRPASRSRAAEF